jgi:hypothetical protein
MKNLLKIIACAILFFNACEAAEALPLNCPQTITCHSAPGHVRVAGPFYYSDVECKIDSDNKLMWENFKINDNFEPSTILKSKDWVTLSFAGAFIPAQTSVMASLDRPRCLYGVYDPYIPHYVSAMRSVNKHFLPAKNSNWHEIKDQYDKSLLVCDDRTASNCGMLLE